MASTIESEHDIQRAILEWLSYQKRVFAWRQNAGMIMREYKGKKYPVRMGQKGISDIIGIYKGIPLAIEVKRPGERATEWQYDFLWKFSNSGGIAMVVHSLEDVQLILEDVKKLPINKRIIWEVSKREGVKQIVTKGKLQAAINVALAKDECQKGGR